MNCRGIAFGTGIFDDEQDEMMHVGEDYVTEDEPRTADAYHYYLDGSGWDDPA